MNDTAGTNEPGSQIASFSFKNIQVRTVDRDGQIWFVASDIARALGYRDAAVLTRWLDDDEKGTHNVQTLGGKQQITILSESGLYHALLKSRKPEARPFRKWVTAEVLPAIRKQGFYGQVPAMEKPAIAPTDIKETCQPLGIIIRKHSKVWMILDNGLAREVWQPLRSVIIGNTDVLMKIARGEISAGIATRKPMKYDSPAFNPLHISIGPGDSVLLVTDCGDPIITGFCPLRLLIGTQQNTSDYIKDAKLTLAFPLQWMETK